MDRGLKTCLIIGGVLVFLGGLAVVGSVTVLYLNKDKIAEGFEELTDDMKVQMEEGKAFGTSADEDGCLQEGLRRIEGKGPFAAVGASLFLTGCFEEAGPSPGFCEDVPAESEIIASATWRNERCAAEGQGGDQGCVQLVSVVQRHCGEANEEGPE